MKSTNFAQYISSYIREYLILERGYSQNTVQSYTQTFVLLLTYTRDERKINIDKVTVETFDKAFILEFLNWLNTKRQSSDATRNIRLAAIHSFFRYLSREMNLIYLNQCQSVLSISFKKTKNNIINYLSPEALKLILSMPNLQTKKGRRDLAMLSLMYDIGARVQEIIDLTPSMLNLKTPMTATIIGKGRKIRVVPLLKDQVAHLEIYMKECGLMEPNNNSHPLFFNNRNEKLTRAGINFILKLYFARAKAIEPALFPKMISCHTLRHTKAMHLRKANQDLVTIRDILGHSSVVTTERYARVESKEKRDAIEAAYINLQPSKNKSKWEGNSSLIEWLNKF